VGSGQVTENYRLILAYEALEPGADASARGRFLAFRALADMTGRSYSDADVLRGSHGRPYIPGAPGFSITHCQGLVVAVVARHGAVGVDAEADHRPTARALRKICDAEEQLLAASKGATWVWVAKEATIKCAGLSAFMAGQVRLWPEFAALRNQLFYLQRPLLATGFAVAIASSERFTDNDMLIRRPPEP
jgi:4'-phosphopantetheinyl transferase EntD